MIEKALTLSTAHMLETDPDFGDLRAIPFEYGFVVWVAKPDHTTPRWIRSVMEHAYNEGCTLIMFDRDAHTHYHFPYWDW